jgi:Helix-turn-helix domain
VLVWVKEIDAGLRPRRRRSCGIAGSIGNHSRRSGGRLVSRRRRSISRLHRTVPFVRCRLRLALTLSEREEISRGVTVHQSVRSMARMLGRSPSTVSREISRNGGEERYRAAPTRVRAAPFETPYSSMALWIVPTRWTAAPARERGPLCPEGRSSSDGQYLSNPAKALPSRDEGLTCLAIVFDI